MRELETMLTEKSDALDALQTRFDALAAAKTREQALEVVRPSDEFERSAQLEAAVREAVVREVIFEEVSGRLDVHAWNPGDDWPDADEQVREGLLIDHPGEGVSPNEDDPGVVRAVAAARELHDWVPSDEYREAFRAEHDVAWAPGTRKLWTELNLF